MNNCQVKWEFGIFSGCTSVNILHECDCSIVPVDPSCQWCSPVKLRTDQWKPSIEVTWSVLANERPVMQSSKTQIKECCSDFRWKQPNNFRYDICKVLSGAIDTISIGYRQLRSPLLHKHSSQAFSFGTKNSFVRIKVCKNLLCLGDLTRLSKKTDRDWRKESFTIVPIPFLSWSKIRTGTWKRGPFSVHPIYKNKKY